MSIYDIVIKDKGNNNVSMNDYKGKVLLIVNTAIKCGFAPQYEELEEIYKIYKDAGLEILDFPCNQFLNQSPGDDAAIGKACKGRFNITFPQYKKIDVNGTNEAPLYTFLKNEKRGICGSKKIKWNFTKFLVDRNGNVVKRFSPSTKPSKILESIKPLL